LTKNERALFEIKSENEKLKNVRKTNITIDTGLDQFMTKRAKAISNIKNAVMTRTEKAL